MKIQDIVRSLNRHEWEDLEYITQKLIAFPEAGRRLISALLRSPALRDDSSISVELLRVLVSHDGQKNVEQRIIEQWPTTSDLEKRRLLSVLQNPDILSTDMAVHLFNSPSSRVEDRHRIVAGLAMSARARMCQDLVVDLLAKVGEYDDPARQALFRRFSLAVIESYGQRRDDCAG